MIQLLTVFLLLGLGSAWNQPSTCYVRQSSCSSNTEHLMRITESLEQSLASISSSLEQLVAQGRDCPAPSTDTPVTTTIASPGTASASTSPPTATEPSTTTIPSTELPTEPPTISSCSPSCNAGGAGWVQVANLDMSDPIQNCPAGFRLVTGSPLAPRACGRTNAARGCVNTTYSVQGMQYSQVCGRVYGYRENTPDGLLSNDIDDVYVDGVSLTHGSPRQHIWTFVGFFVSQLFPAVGDQYFCTAQQRAWVTPDTCSSQCSTCTVTTPPWFCMQLPEPTTDDIELRICGNSGIDNEDTPIDLVEIYIRASTGPFPVGTLENPVSSCQEIPQGSQSGQYYISNGGSPAQLVYCDMDGLAASCSNCSEGGWARVANFDMTVTSQNCPTADFVLVTRPSAPMRTCGRIADDSKRCVSTIYPTYGIAYSQVCGRVRGYAYGSPDGFRSNDIDGIYVDGVSLTYGQSPRQHIWSFGAYNQGNSNRDSPFVGNNFFCGYTAPGNKHIPIWVGSNCAPEDNCCTMHNPPWFCIQLSQSTTEDIELRLCADEPVGTDDPQIDQVEIYVR